MPVLVVVEGVADTLAFLPCRCFLDMFSMPRPVGEVLDFKEKHIHVLIYLLYVSWTFSTQKINSM
jgi:hypothetical protein